MSLTQGLCQSDLPEETGEDGDDDGIDPPPPDESASTTTVRVSNRTDSRMPRESCIPVPTDVGCRPLVEMQVPTPKGRRHPNRARTQTRPAYQPSFENVRYTDGAIHVSTTKEAPTNFQMSESEVMENVLGVALVQQFSLKAGLKKFGPRGEKAVTK